MGDYYAIRSENYLEHHGILGQKWGVRRFQNLDGTRTNAGLKREKQYREGEIDSSGKVKRTPEEKKEQLRKAGKIAAVVVGTAAVAASAVYVAKNKDNITKAVDNAMHNMRIQKAEKALDKQTRTLAGKNALTKMQLKVGAVKAGVDQKTSPKIEKLENDGKILGQVVKEQIRNYGMTGKVDVKGAKDRLEVLRNNSNFRVVPTNESFKKAASGPIRSSSSGIGNRSVKSVSQSASSKGSSSANGTLMKIGGKLMSELLDGQMSMIYTPELGGPSVIGSSSKKSSSSSSSKKSSSRKSVEDAYRELDDYTAELIRKNGNG